MAFYISMDSLAGPFFSEVEAVQAACKLQKQLKGTRFGSKKRKAKVLIEVSEVDTDGTVSR